MKGYPLVPGVLDAGHSPAQGVWHPGDKVDCPECKPAPPPPRPIPLIEVKVEVVIPVPNRGSDCKTGKVQFATRKAAMGSYHSLQRRREGLAPRPYRCAWCLCWHVGNRRSNASKGRGRR